MHIGYQSLALLGGDRQGDSRLSVSNYVKGEGEFWELWDGNGRDPEFAAGWSTKLPSAIACGPAAYRPQLSEVKTSE